jgi:opine dehydrogenase
VTSLKYVIVGAGNGGLALAAELALRGRDITLLELPRFADRLDPIRAQRGIRVEARTEAFWGGRGEHLARLDRITTDTAAVRDADIIIPVVPAQHHDAIILEIAAHLRRGQIVLLDPGGVGGALVWRRALLGRDLTGIPIAQSSDLTYAGSRTEPGKVLVKGKKARVLFGVFPAVETARVLGVLAGDFPEFSAAENVLEAGLSGPGMSVHPLPMMMNAVKIDRDAPLKYDAYDISPTVARVIEALDVERTAIIAALGSRPRSISEILGDYYGATGSDFNEVVGNVSAYKGSTAPRDFSARYITEEVPTQVVPAALIGHALGIATPIMDAMVNLASAIRGENYWSTGWTLDRLGLAGLDAPAIERLLRDG